MNRDGALSGGGAEAELQARYREMRAEPERGPALLALIQTELRQGLTRSLPIALRDIQTWSGFPSFLQDQVLLHCAKRLRWPLVESRSWPCGSRELRIGSFRDPLSGLIFNLIPGNEDLPPFLISRFPVTREDWPDDNPTIELARSIPKTELSFSEAAQWLSERGLRLPSRAEWRHSASAASEARWPWGEGFDSSQVWHSGNSAATIADVLRLGPEIAALDEPFAHPCLDHFQGGAWNAFGLVDMFGNVWEMLQEGALAGGSYRTSLHQLEAEYELPLESFKAPTIGLRAARSLDF